MSSSKNQKATPIKGNHIPRAGSKRAKQAPPAMKVNEGLVAEVVRKMHLLWTPRDIELEHKPNQAELMAAKEMFRLERIVESNETKKVAAKAAALKARQAQYVKEAMEETRLQQAARSNATAIAKAKMATWTR